MWTSIVYCYFLILSRGIQSSHKVVAIYWSILRTWLSCLMPKVISFQSLCWILNITIVGLTWPMVPCYHVASSQWGPIAAALSVFCRCHLWPFNCTAPRRSAEPFGSHCCSAQTRPRCLIFQAPTFAGIWVSAGIWVQRKIWWETVWAICTTAYYFGSHWWILTLPDIDHAALVLMKFCTS